MTIANKVHYCRSVLRGYLPCTQLWVVLAATAFCSQAQVVSLDTNYTVSLFASGLALPEPMLFRSETNDMLVIENSVNRIGRVDASTGALSVFATLPPNLPSRANDGYGYMAMNAARDILANVYFTGGPMLQYDPSGKLLNTFPFSPGFPRAMAYDAAGNLYVDFQPPSLATSTQIYKYAGGDLTGPPTLFADGLSVLDDMKFNTAGELFATEFFGGNVYKVTPGGLTAASHTVWASGLFEPQGLAFEPTTQAIYVSTGDGKLVRISDQGVVEVVATGFVANNFGGIVFDPQGNIYVDDSFAGVIWKFTKVVGTTISPTHGGNAGSVTVQIIGGNFQTGATVKLTGIGSDIVGSNTALLNPSVLSTQFDLTSSAPGTRTVLITNPDGTTVSLPGVFTVESGGAPQISVDIVGLDKIRLGQSQTYYVTAANAGNVDWAGLSFVAVKVTSGIDPVTISFGDQLVSQFHPTPLNDNSGNSLVGTFALPAIPAGGSAIYTIQLAASLSALSTIQLEVDPFQVPVAAPTLPNPLGQFTDAINQRKMQELGDPLPPLDEVFFESLQEALKDLWQKYAITLLLHPINVVVNKWSLNQEWKDIVNEALKQVAEQFPNAATAYADAWDNVIGAQSAGFFDSALYANYMSTRPPWEPYDLPTRLKKIGVVASRDPNAKVGPDGAGQLKYVRGTGALDYQISFGNSEAATAPAQKVVINDALESSLDMTRVLLGPIVFAGHTLTPSAIPLSIMPSHTVVDLRPATNLLVKVEALLNTSSGLLTWTLQCIDPTTGESPVDPTVGFLPPGAGGSVFFTVLPKSTATTGTVIQNTATITFDANAPINTPTWSNALDMTPPVSQVVSLPASETSTNFTVQWSGSDIGSGVATYTIYVSDNGGPFSPFETNTAATSATFAGQAGHTYGFYSIAADAVGNVEPAKTVAEATTTLASAVAAAGQVATTSSGLAYSRVSKTFNGTVTVTNVGTSTLNGPFEIVFSGLPQGITLANATGSFNGSSFLTVPNAASLSPGQSATASIQFTDPSNVKINFTPIVYLGVFK